MLTLLLTVLLSPASADDMPSPPPEPGTLAHNAWQVLAQRHDAGCEAVLALGSGVEVREALLTIAEGADAPPWAPLRAAACLTEHMGSDIAVQPALKRWVEEERWSGLGVAVLQHVDALAEAQAVQLVDTALARTDERFADKARRTVARSDRATVRARLEATSVQR